MVPPPPIFFSTFSSFPGTTDSKETTLIGASSEAGIMYGSHLNPLPLLLYLTKDNKEGEGETDNDIDGVTEGDCVTVAVVVTVGELVGVGVGKHVSVGLGVGSAVEDGVRVCVADIVMVAVGDKEGV